jgi:hypothetical protein
MGRHPAPPTKKAKAPASAGADDDDYTSGLTARQVPYYFINICILLLLQLLPALPY